MTFHAYQEIFTPYENESGVKQGRQFTRDKKFGNDKSTKDNLLISTLHLDKRSKSVASVGSKSLRKLTKRHYDNDIGNLANDQYSVWEDEIVTKITTNIKDSRIYNDTVFGGNNIVCCMFRKRIRCFGGHKPSRLFLSFLLINVPGTIFLALIKFISFDPLEQAIYFWIGVAL